jgi:Fe-S-cluster containining protein
MAIGIYFVNPDFASSVREASGRAEVITAVEMLYAQLAQEIERRRPVCGMSGRCCHFEDYGHRLYLTTAEMATFLFRLGSQRPPAAAWDGRGCPWQQGTTCSVHTLRPFGCRIYFCDPSAKLWQEQLYERLHAQLKQIHEQHQVPYFYTEWRLALRSLWPGEF